MGAREYYDENNGWTFRWGVPHNIADLIDLMGGREEFTSNLDDLFAEPLGRSKYRFYRQFSNQTGSIGQFAAGNEPGFHIPYLYNYAGQPWKTQKYIRFIMDTWFRDDVMGIPGDEDAGSMSAFVVLSAMGFYPVTSGMPVYNIGSPIFDEITIYLSNVEEFRIVANNNSKHNKYIQSARLNGNSLNKPWFLHEETIHGGTLELEMGPHANRQWGSQKEVAPPSFELK
jgi:predicted alpha-1,2-mannosidase